MLLVPDTAHNNEFDRDASAFVYRRCQELRVPLRIFTRHAWCADSADYDALQTLCQNNLNQHTDVKRLDYWQDYHAQLVVIGNRYCRPKNPRCEGCPLFPLLPT